MTMSMEQLEIDRLGRLFAEQARSGGQPIRVLSPSETPVWVPIDQAPPSGQFLVRGPSGYRGYEVFVTLAHREPEYRGDAWLFPGGDRLSECGWEPTHFMPFFTAIGFRK